MESSNNKRKADEIDAPAPKRQHTNVIAREPSIFGVKPVDDVTKYIADFIAEHCQLENVEVCGLSLSTWCYWLNCILIDWSQIGCFDRKAYKSKNQYGRFEWNK